jgi:antitoxin component of MazEF toxin-antitoxin module
MQTVKIRRVGNSNVVTIPAEFEADGYTAGATVIVDQAADGSLTLVPERSVREMIRSAARQIIREDQETLEILAQHDADASSSA